MKKFVKISGVWQPKNPEEFDEQFFARIHTFLDDQSKPIGPTFIHYGGYEAKESDPEEYYPASWYGQLDYGKGNFDFGAYWDDEEDRFIPTNFTGKKIGLGEVFTLVEAGEEATFKIMNVQAI